MDYYQPNTYNDHGDDIAHLHPIDIKFTNFGYYAENPVDNMNDMLMPVSFVNFYNCLFDNWELKYPLVKAITKVKFSRMLLICIYYFITIRLFGVYWWISRFHCT